MRETLCNSTKRRISCFRQRLSNGMINRYRPRLCVAREEKFMVNIEGLSYIKLSLIFNDENLV